MMSRVMGGDDEHAVLDRVQPMQGVKCIRPIRVDKKSWKGGLLAKPLNLGSVPRRLPRQEDQTSPGSQQYAHAARSVPRQANQKHRSAAEEVITMLKRQHWRTPPQVEPVYATPLITDRTPPAGACLP